MSSYQVIYVNRLASENCFLFNSNIYYCGTKLYNFVCNIITAFVLKIYGFYKHRCENFVGPKSNFRILKVIQFFWRTSSRFWKTKFSKLIPRITISSCRMIVKEMQKIDFEIPKNDHFREIVIEVRVRNVITCTLKISKCNNFA